MTTEISTSYDAMAERYAKLVLTDLDGNDNAVRWLARFAAAASDQPGLVADLGCGPGHVVAHLSDLGLDVVGYDVSPGQIEQARLAFPDHHFDVGDFAQVGHDDGSLGGILARYSIIHTEPSEHVAIYREWLRALGPGAPVLISFFASRAPQAHGTPFDHKVVTAYELDPATVAAQLAEAGFTDIEVHAIPIPPGGRPLDEGTVLARKPRV